jgi:hypothetical protein
VAAHVCQLLAQVRALPPARDRRRPQLARLEDAAHAGSEQLLRSRGQRAQRAPHTLGIAERGTTFAAGPVLSREGAVQPTVRRRIVGLRVRRVLCSWKRTDRHLAHREETTLAHACELRQLPSVHSVLRR